MTDTPIQGYQEQLTRQFYAWERRGRGWQVWDYPVELEPPFRPFFHHYVKQAPILDDARKPGVIRSIIDNIRDDRGNKGPGSGTSILDLGTTEDLEFKPEPAGIEQELELAELAVSIPRACSIKKDIAEQFILGFNNATGPVAFEVIGTSQEITIQLATSEPGAIQRQIRSYFPEAAIKRQDGFLKQYWENAGPYRGIVVEFGLSNEFMMLLKACRSFDIDPLISIVGALSDLEENETGILQVIFQAVQNPWSESILRAVTDNEGRSFFDDAPEMLSLAKQKVAHPLFAAVIRVAARSSDCDRTWKIARTLGAGFSQLANPTINELIPLSNDGYDDDAHESDLLLRQTHRSGMILSSEELVSLVHPPSAAVSSEKLRRDERRTRAAPAVVCGQGLVIGENIHSGKINRVTLSPDQRIRHTYVIGASGTGKSTLLLNMIVQDIQNGEGLAVLDPHGDLIDQILDRIPEERFQDVIVLDPSDEEFPIGFNILSAHSELEKTLLASDLVAVFRRLSTSWGDQMTSVLGNAILAILESRIGGTLADLRRLLIEADFRRSFLESVTDPEVVYFWEKGYPLLSGKPQAPLLTRLDTFLRPKPIRYMMLQKENRLDFRKIMDGRKILLAKLAQGALGEENSYLLGTLLVSKLHQMAIGRQDVSETKRSNFYLYIDEFHNFITPSMASILSGARKYHLGLILAHQELRQLWNRDTDVASAVISNPCTRICFRSGDFDAQKLEDGFSFFEARDLQNLGVGEAIVRIEKKEFDFNLKTLPLPAVDARIAETRRERLIALSRSSYAARKQDIEAALMAATKIPKEPPKEKAEQTPKIVEQPGKLKPVRPEVEFRAEPVIKGSPPKPPAMAPDRPPTSGRGGQQHKYLQQLIKRLAEDKGYRAIIEKGILDGVGSVDVSLEKDDRKIACEISVTSAQEQELSNIQKCLAAGYDQVIIVATEKKELNRLRIYIAGQLEAKVLEKILFLLPEELIGYLEDAEAHAATKEKTVRGYRVKVNYRALGEEEKKTKRQAISGVILRAVKRMKANVK